jgi:adenine deaminase
VVDQGKALPLDKKQVPIWVRRSVRTAPVRPSDLQIECRRPSVRVMQIIPGQLLTNSLVMKPRIEDGYALADPERDLAKIAVVERHHSTGRIGKGFVTGFGLRRGAFASTVAHDAHNIVVVGVSDDDMALCATRLQDMGGGIVVCARGAVTGELPLPVAGLLSDEPFETVVARLDDAHLKLHSLGVEIVAPFMTLSFLALSVIPALKITDQGLVDVNRFQLVTVETDADENEA